MIILSKFVFKYLGQHATPPFQSHVRAIDVGETIVVHHFDNTTVTFRIDSQKTAKKLINQLKTSFKLFFYILHHFHVRMKGGTNNTLIRT